ncbi:MAG: AAA family ATPase, partial [Clostridium celatum]|nr:AAA family ATPase [Clostridium celatum]
MKRELTPSEIKFKISVTDNEDKEGTKGISEFNNAYRKIERALSIDKEGYNLYLIDTFSRDKLNELIKFVEEKYKDLEAPRDICYVTLEDINKPEAIFVSNGQGNKLKEAVDNIKNSYLEAIDDFYSDSTNDEKDYLVEEIQTKRNNYLNELMKMAKDEGFEVKATNKGFAFIPLSGDEAMTEKEYDNLEEENKNVIVAKASTLKKKAESILEELKEIEVKSIKRLKKIYSKYLSTQMEEAKDDALLEFITDDDSYEYLERLFNCIEEDIIECYTMNIEDDENEIYEILNKYDVKVIVDNTNVFSPPVIYEEDPNLNNLIGLIEYENHNGMYTTNISLINAGSILKANEGCLILRLNSLISNPMSYYYLKKILLSNTLSFDTNKSYLEFININGLKPNPIPVKIKVIIVGDYESYDILYNSDEDFRSLFPLRAEFTSIIEINNNSLSEVKNIINEKIRKDNLFNISYNGINEIIKYL